MFRNAWSFKSPTNFVFGDGVSKKLGEYLKKLQISKPLLVTDEVVKRLGMADRLMNGTKEYISGYEIYSSVMPEPPVENVYEALAVYQNSGCDGVIGLGGGSPIDVAKAVAMLVTNPGKVEPCLGIGNVQKKCAPLVLIPTTSGTGYEVSMFSILIVNGAKAGIVDENITANLALVDPELTYSVPRSVTATTGLDALCHHLESFLSVNACALHQPLCLDGIRIIGKYLRKAVGYGFDTEARYQMALASAIGGYASNLSEGAAANHGLAFALGAKYHVAHGLANAVLIKHVLPVIGIAELEKMRLIGEAMGVEMDGLSDREAMDASIEAISMLIHDVGCDIPLSTLGVKEADLDEMVAETLRQARVMGHSTYQLTPVEIKQIFLNAL